MNKRQRKKKTKKVEPIKLEIIQQRTPKQLNRFSPARLRKTYQKLRATANKRLQRLEKAGFANTNIYQQYQYEFVNPARDLTDTEIKEQILKVRKFLGTNESTVREQRKQRKQLKESATVFNDILNQDIDTTQFVMVDKEKQPQNKKIIVRHTDFIDINDEEQLKMYGDFMDNIRYNLSAEIKYSLEELFELWNMWRNEGQYLGKFSNAPLALRNLWFKFVSSPNTSPISSTKDTDTRKSERKRFRIVYRNRNK